MTATGEVVRTPATQPSAAALVVAPVSFEPRNATADPCSDFAEYACGAESTWVGPHTGQAAWRQPAVWRFLDELAAGKHDDGSSGTALVRDFYKRCRDLQARDRGLGELRRELERIGRIGTLAELARTLGALRAAGSAVLVTVEVARDMRLDHGPAVALITSARPVAGLPGSLYAPSQRLAQEVRTHWTRLAALTEVVTAADVDAAIEIDRIEAAHTSTKPGGSATDRIGAVDRKNLAGARFPWADYLEAVGVPPAAPLAVLGTTTLEQVDRLAELPLGKLTSYLRVALVEEYAESLTRPFLIEEARFHDAYVSNGHVAAAEVDQTCVSLTSRELHTFLTDAYLPRLVDRRAEGVAREMFGILRGRLAGSVHDAGWLDGPSRQSSEAKVRGVGLRLIDDVEAADPGGGIGPGSFLDAGRQLRSLWLRAALAKVGGPSPAVMRPSFDISAYGPEENAIWLSPEVVRAPFIRGAASDPVSLGALGTLIGHELGHSLSPYGSRFNAAGLYREAWSQETRAAFNARVSCVDRQFDRLLAASAPKVSARQTSDENVADLIGVRIALAALDSGGQPTSPDALRAARRAFFLTFAQTFCGFGAPHLTDLEAVRDRHAPLRARINGTVANVPAFAETFACPAGAPLAPRDRCVVW